MITRRAILAAALNPQRQLAPPVPSAIAFIAVHSRVVVEIGAGDGYWLAPLRRAGVEAQGYDLTPRSPDVRLGSHLDAARHVGADMLAVWPPDGPEVARWVRAAPWPRVYLVGNQRRFQADGALAGYEEFGRMDLPAGYEGNNEMVAWRLRPA